MSQAEPSLQHGFEDASRDADALHNAFRMMQPSVTKQTLKQLWRETLGPSAEPLKRVLVVGRNPIKLSRWRRGKADGIVQTVLIQHEDLNHESGDMILFLGGAEQYFVSGMEEFIYEDLQGSIVMASVGQGMNAPATIFQDQEDGQVCPSIEKYASVAIIGLLFVNLVSSYENTMHVRGALRMIECFMFPFLGSSPNQPGYTNGWIEISSFINVHDGGSFVGEKLALGPCSCSGVETKGRAIVEMDGCSMLKLGRGDYNQRPHPADSIVMRGASPVIAVSDEAKILMRNCTFRHNYGYIAQYKDRYEQHGMTSRDVHVLRDSKSPEEFAQHLVECRCKGGSITSDEEKSALFHAMIAERTSELERAKREKIKGYVSFVGCVNDTRDIAPSPLMEGYPDRHRLELKQYFPESSVFFDHEEYAPYDTSDPRTENERKAWSDKSVNPRVHAVFDVIAADHGLITELKKYVFKLLFLCGNPKLFYHDQLKKANPNESAAELEAMVETRFPLLNENDVARLREQRKTRLARTMSRLCDLVRGCFRGCKPLEIEQVCWGCLDCASSMFRRSQEQHCHMLIAASTLIAFMEEIDVTSTRTQILANLLYCNEFKGRTEDDECDCGLESIPIQSSIAVLSLLSEHHPVVCETLKSVIADDLGSDHGRLNASQTLAWNSFWKGDPSMRWTAIDCISRTLCGKNDLREDTRGELVLHLESILARSCRSRVRLAFVRFTDIEGTMFGEAVASFVGFLMRVGLSVDLNDSLVEKELTIRAPSLPARSDIEEYNSSLESISKKEKCSFCFDPLGIKSLCKCNRCRDALYCGEVCQRKDWSTHQRVCRQRGEE